MASPDPLRIETERLVPVMPKPECAPRLAAYYLENTDHPWPSEPVRSPYFYTATYWRAQLEQNLREVDAGASMRRVAFALCDEGGKVLGSCNYNNIVRGAFPACHLGGSLARRSTGKGLMTEALRAANAHVFGELGLYRIMANHMPNNERSARVLRGLGFQVEGYARDYLFLAGGWRDPVLTSLLHPGPPKAG